MRRLLIYTVLILKKRSTDLYLKSELHKVKSYYKIVILKKVDKKIQESVTLKGMAYERKLGLNSVEITPKA